MPRGSLPRYLVNIEELVSMFPLEAKSMFNPDKAKQRCKGIYLDLNGEKTRTEKWEIPKDIVLTGIKVACSSESEWFMDNFDLSIESSGEEQELFTSVYMKDFMEYKHFVCYHEILAGSTIIIRYRNKSESDKDVWFDIDYIAE